MTFERALLWTEQEAADRLCLSARTLRKLRQEGAIRYVALTSRRVAYRPEDCQAYIEAQTRIAPPAPRRPRRGKPMKKGNVTSFAEWQARQ